MIASISRINELAKKSKDTGLTPAEKVEQQVLREDYLREIRGQIENTVTSLKVLDPLGDDVTPEKVKNEKKLRQQ